MDLRIAYNAACGATRDRYDIMKNAIHPKKNLDPIEKKYLTNMQQISGTHTKNPIKAMVNWYKAFQHNTKRQEMIKTCNAPFQKPTIFTYMKKGLKNIAKR